MSASFFLQVTQCTGLLTTDHNEVTGLLDNYMWQLLGNQELALPGPKFADSNLVSDYLSTNNYIICPKNFPKKNTVKRIQTKCDNLDCVAG